MTRVLPSLVRVTLTNRQWTLLRQLVEAERISMSAIRHRMYSGKLDYFLTELETLDRVLVLGQNGG
jgi:hypothetical protein